MRSIYLHAPAFFVALLLYDPAVAINCKLRLTHAENLICNDRDLNAADTNLNATYRILTQQIADPEVLHYVRASQKRWLKARNGDFNWNERAEDGDDRRTDRAMLLSAINDRIEYLSIKSKRNIVQTIESQQQQYTRYSGGPFAGFKIECFFAPPKFGDGAYVCAGSQTYQNGDRVCRSSIDWASNHETEYRTVGNAGGSMARLEATCASGYASSPEPCDSRWNLKPEATDDFPQLNAGDSRLNWKYDPDAPEAPPWLDVCLTDQTYPTSKPTP